MFAVRTQFLATLWPMVELLRQCVQVVQNNDHMRSPDANGPVPVHVDLECLFVGLHWMMVVLHVWTM